MNSHALKNIEALNVPEAELSEFIDVDMPFNSKEVEKATSRRYVEQLTRSDMQIVAIRCFATTDKKMSRAALPTDHVFDPIDVDMPFSAAEVIALTSEAYVSALGRSDMPIVGH
jgi:hypothetical protein